MAWIDPSSGLAESARRVRSLSWTGPELRVSLRRDGATVRVSAFGVIDPSTEGPWRELLSAAVEPEQRLVVLDLSGVTYLSPASTTPLVRAHYACSAAGVALHVMAGSDVLDTLRLTGLDRLLTVSSIPTARVPHQRIAVQL